MGFTQSLANGNGYYHLPSGLITQWGMVSFTSMSTNTFYTSQVVFPITYLSSYVVASTGNSSPNIKYRYGVTNESNTVTGFIIVIVSSGSTNVYWTSIGY